MSVRTPHFLLFSKTAQRDQQPAWAFEIRTAGGVSQLKVEDVEPDVVGERLELLAVVRGLEAIAQPSAVTLVTSSKYVSRGITNGLEEWRCSGWQWERHGEMVPVKNCDLWQRVDRAMQVHRVQLRRWRIDDAHDIAASHHVADSHVTRLASNSSITAQPNIRQPRRAVGSRRHSPQRRTGWARKVLRHATVLRRQLRNWIDAIRLSGFECENNQIVNGRFSGSGCR